MAEYLGYQIIDQTAFRIASVAPAYSILRADYGDGYADTALVGMPGGVKAFTAVAGLWSDDEFYGTIGGQAWMAYYYDFLSARLAAGNEPFIIFWRSKFWLVDLDEPRFALEALKSFNSDMFVPAAIRLNLRRVRGVEFAADGSLAGLVKPEVPSGLTLTLTGAFSFIAEWPAPPDEVPPSVPAMAAATEIAESSIRWNWTAATDNVAVTNYDLQVAKDAAFTVDVVTVPLGNVLTYNHTSLDDGTTYYARVRAKDAAGNASAYSSSVNATTIETPTGNWEAPVPTNWSEGVDFSRTATASSFAGVTHTVLPKFNNVGDYIEMQCIDDGGGYLGSYRLADSLAKVATLVNTGAINSTDEPAQFPAGWAEGDVVKIEKTGATQFTRYINGAGAVVINQALTGEVELTWETQTVSPTKHANPVTNI